jgi:predicted phosphate transport protein (TIGR00153 family)
MNFIRAIMPREDAFFTMFARHAETLVGGADTLYAMLDGKLDVGEACRKIADFEHKADDVAREVLTAVRRTFITPFDRSAITSLIGSMDDAIDEMHQTGKAITLYDVTSFEPLMVRMAELATQAARLIQNAIPLLRNSGRNVIELTRITEEIVHLEGDADDLHEQGLKQLFQAHGETRPMAFFVGREVFRHLERVLDGMEDVADEIQGIVIDHA